MNRTQQYLWAVLALCALALGATPARALPVLQLTVAGGTYVGSSETTVAGSGEFVLYALGDPGRVHPGDTFYISAALEQGTAHSDSTVGPAPVAAGSFTFNGQSIDATGDMTFGQAGGSLQTHGEYLTYYRQFAFTFTGARTTAFNAQTATPGGPLAAGCTADCLYFDSFVVNVDNLDPAYSIHFDLYHLAADGTVDRFAPFSHDAQSGRGGDLPEPGTLALFGLALAGTICRDRRRRL